jgi:DNA primase
MRTNPKLIDLWTKAADQYHASLAGSPAEAYLASRGVLDGAEEFKLGYVAEVAPGHEDRIKHHLSIPYLTGAGVVGFKFRRIDGGDPKYMIPTGQKHHLYNVAAILHAVNQVLVVEGEIDAISSTLAGHPAVAVAGVNAWKSHFARCFDGIGTVIIATDNDVKEDGSNPGQDLARRLQDAIPQAVRVSLPPDSDINSIIMSQGAQALTDLVNAINN